ncbi:random septum position protein Rsp1 [Schizosaccharomyces japonicus yFS275]|uniref:Random septum position protein Rsp1 n=1 Tax=Schizosaccharomyces japonicus (strain yFS275 / FY16936) TaxID=402676 RepID=B6K370_SCHJY|nr:random septum position protein Rsp1 [Schizosaccharomyces japonicus yFS275]EEB07927.1 random septum position protein Rsp1 [Schizosaccharomyces japonicus yFS275]
MGVPSVKEPFVDHYAVLDVDSHSTYSEIRQKYLRLVLQYHPDRNAGHEELVLEKFQKIQRAHDVLKDSRSRAAFDRERLLHIFGVGPSSQTSYSARDSPCSSSTPLRKHRNNLHPEVVPTSKLSPEVRRQLFRSKDTSDEKSKSNTVPPHRSSAKQDSRYFSNLHSFFRRNPTEFFEEQPSENGEHTEDYIKNAFSSKTDSLLFSSMEAKAYLETLRKKRTSQRTPEVSKTEKIHANTVYQKAKSYESRSAPTSRNTTPLTKTHPYSLDQSDHLSPDLASSPSMKAAMHLPTGLHDVELSFEDSKQDVSAMASELEPPAVPIATAPIPPVCPSNLSDSVQVAAYLNEFRRYQAAWNRYAETCTAYMIAWQTYKNKCFSLDVSDVSGHAQFIEAWTKGSRLIQVFSAYECVHFEALQDLIRVQTKSKINEPKLMPP